MANLNLQDSKYESKKPLRQRASYTKDHGAYNKDKATETEIVPTRHRSSQHTNLDTDHRHLNPTPELTTYGGIKLGWIQGVLIPCLLNIWGVMLFLRIAWVVAQAGVWLVVLMIFISSVVCVITTLSLSAICTNGEVKGGGVYYLVSRSLGAELGASVGIIFAFANAVAASMNTIGFCESLNELLMSKGLKIIDNSVNDIRIVGAVTLFLMCVICAIGMDWETLTQNFLIAIILIAISNYVLGCFVGPMSESEKAKGFIGLNAHTVQTNLKPDFRYSEGQLHNFFSVFAIYFPAVTGVQAGANICGDLKNPAEAIPKGTLTALGVSTTSYLVMAVLAGSGALRDASGKMEDIGKQELDCKPKCPYGLHNSYEIMHLMALWGPLIYGGCWAATLSTALTNLLSVPRLIQALGVDRIYPGLIVFSKRYGKHGEPYRGYVLVYIVSLLFLLIADLNTIAPLITNFYLASYALINFCTFHAGFIRHISWRPTFHFYNTWLSLAGFVLCVAMMTIISWIMALATACIFFILYFLVLYRKPMVAWGSSTDAYRYRETVTTILTMTHRPGHVKEYSPQPIVMAGKPSLRPALLDLAHIITNTGSFMIVVDITSKNYTQSAIKSRQQKIEDWLQYRKYRAFYQLMAGMDMEVGPRAALQCCGLGRLSPNIMLVGYKADWRISTHKDLLTYVRTIKFAFERQIAVCILRMSEQNLTHEISTEEEKDSIETRAQNCVLTVMHSSSDLDLRTDHSDTHIAPTTSEKILSTDIQKSDSVITLSPVDIGKSHLYKQLRFTRESAIDVWWLYDDGGLNILLPYIIANRGTKYILPLRIFALARQHHKMDEAKQYIENLLKMFRIECTHLSLVTGLFDPPSDVSQALFNSLIQKHRSASPSECLITDDDLNVNQTKTARYLRLRELVYESSSLAGLVVMSLPMPRKDSISAALYMTWLEIITRDMPPMLLVRGNDNAVLYA